MSVPFAFVSETVATKSAIERKRITWKGNLSSKRWKCADSWSLKAKNGEIEWFSGSEREKTCGIYLSVHQQITATMHATLSPERLPRVYLTFPRTVSWKAYDDVLSASFLQVSLVFHPNIMQEGSGWWFLCRHYLDTDLHILPVTYTCEYRFLHFSDPHNGQHGPMCNGLYVSDRIDRLSPKYFLPSEKIFSISLLPFGMFSPPLPSSALRQGYPGHHVSRSAACLFVHDVRDRWRTSFRPSQPESALFCLFLGLKRVFFDFFQLFCEKITEKACRFKNNAYLCTPNSNGGLERGKQPRE